MFLFFMKIQRFWDKRTFRFWILRKTPVQNQKILVSCETWFPFFNDISILHSDSNTIKEAFFDLWGIHFKNGTDFYMNLGRWQLTLQRSFPVFFFILPVIYYYKVLLVFTLNQVMLYLLDTLVLTDLHLLVLRL